MIRVFENLLESVLLEFMGVSAKWVFYAIVNKLKGQEVKGFSEIWNGRKGASDPDLFFHGLSNILAGYLVVIFLIGLVF